MVNICTDEILNKYDRGHELKENANAGGDTLTMRDSYIVNEFHKAHAMKIAVAADEHREGRIHIHDLGSGMSKPYCSGFDLMDLIHKGLGIPGNVRSKPAKHLDTVISQLVELFQICSNEFAGAQAVSSFDTLCAPFVYKDELRYDEVRQNMQQLVYHLNYPSRQAFQCVTEDTEVLTPDGWKSHFELNVGDDIYTWNDGDLRIQRVNHVKAYDFDGVMHHYSGRDVVQQVTPEHRVIYKKNNCDEFAVKKSCELIDNKSPLTIPVATPECTLPDYEISDEEIMMAAIVLCDGTINTLESGSQRITIYKSPNRYGNGVITTLLNELCMSYKHTVIENGYGDGGAVNRYQVTVDGSRNIVELLGGRKDILPDWVTKLSRRQANMFIHTWAEFDGQANRLRLQCDNYDIADTIQHVAFIAGYGSRQWERTIGDNTNPTVYVTCYKRNVKDCRLKERVRYHGKVWCPTTDDGIVVYRKEGHVFVSGNTPFTNISMDWKVSGEIAEEPAIIGGEPYEDYVYGDFQDEINMIDEAFLDVMKEGYSNKTFTFPIPTYSVQDESIFQYFDRPVTREQRKQNLLWEVTAARGSPYFMNYLGSGLSANTRKSMCCRLSLDTSKVKEKVRGGLWNIGVKTGSMAIVTANLNRCALRAAGGGMDAYFDELSEIMSVMTKQLLQRKEHVFSAYRRGQLPYAKEYLGDGSDDPNDAFGGFFLTHGIVGAYDGFVNLMGDNGFYKEFVKETLDHIIGYQEDLEGHEIEYLPGKFSEWDMWNVEQTPAEGCAWKLANLDREHYPGCFVSGGEGEDVYLTNSTHLPVDVGDILEHMELRSETDIMYNGGTLFNWYSNEATDPVTAMETVKMLCQKTKMPYVAFSPTHGACEECGNLQTGTEPRCNRCDSPIKLMTRVVGYVRETDRFNPGQLKQYKNRSYFTV